MKRAFLVKNDASWKSGASPAVCVLFPWHNLARKCLRIYDSPPTSSNRDYAWINAEFCPSGRPRTPRRRAWCTTTALINTSRVCETARQTKMQERECALRMCREAQDAQAHSRVLMYFLFRTISGNSLVSNLSHIHTNSRYRWWRGLESKWVVVWTTLGKAFQLSPHE